MATRKYGQGTKGQTQPGKQPSGGGTKPPRPKPQPPPVAPGPPAPAEDGDSDPPIIISGGSVTIESEVFLSSRFDAAKGRYIYENKDIKIGKMQMHGKKGEQNDDSDNGKFRIGLSKV